MTRIHYFCPQHWKVLQHGRAIARKDRARVCCYCPKPARFRARTSVVAPCAPGHLAPGAFERIAGAALSAAVEDNPLPFGVGVELEVGEK